MTIPTTAETLLLNTEPQYSDLYLSIYEPEMAGIFRVSGSAYSRANQSIAYNSTISGSYTNVDTYAHYVSLVGTTAGSDDLGRTWLRAITSNTLRFVVSDHINWDASVFVTVLKYAEIIPLFPRIIQDPSNEENVIFYKLWDIPYTNQNSILGSFINMGSNYAGFLENGTGTCYWSASGTTDLLGSTLTHSWIFEGGIPTGSNVRTPGNVVWNAPGHHRVIYSATSTGTSRVDSSIRYVSFYERPGEGDNLPIINWELLELSGERDSIGYTCRIRIRETVSKTKLRDGALIVIFGEDWYGSTKQSISNNAKGRETIKFVGYIVGGTIQYSYRDGWVEFEAVSPTNFMEMCECFSCSVESKTSPTTWYELLNMDIRRAVYHYLAWQSSVLKCCDVEFRNFTDRNTQYFDADRTSLYDAVNSLVDGARVGKIVSDSLGKIWIEQEVSVLDNVATTFPNVLSVEKKQWLDEPMIDERQHQEYAYIERGGIQYSPSTNKSAAYLSGAPGLSPAYRGKQDTKQGLALGSQSELNTITGNLYAYMNSRYPNVEIKMRANLNHIDIAPQELVSLTIASSDTPRDITFTNKKFAVRGKSISWEGNTRKLLSTLILSEVTQGFTGDTIIIPVEPPDEGDDPDDIIPDDPPTPPDEPPVEEEPSGVDAVVIQSDDVRTSTNLDQATPTWITEI